MCLCNLTTPVEFLNMTSNEDQRDQQKECGCYGPFGLHSIACIHAVKNRQPSVREIVEGKAELDAALDDISDEAYIKAGKAAVRLEEGLERLAKVKLAKAERFNDLVKLAVRLSRTAELTQEECVFMAQCFRLESGLLP